MIYLQGRHKNVINVMLRAFHELWDFGSAGLVTSARISLPHLGRGSWVFVSWHSNYALHVEIVQGFYTIHMSIAPPSQKKRNKNGFLLVWWQETCSEAQAQDVVQ